MGFSTATSTSTLTLSVTTFSRLASVTKTLSGRVTRPVRPFGPSRTRPEKPYLTVMEPGRITVKYGFSGRVLLGPKGRTGRVTLPLNVFVTDARREKVVTDSVKVDVDVAVEKPIGY